jgi:hypothetical protein
VGSTDCRSHLLNPLATGLDFALAVVAFKEVIEVAGVAEGAADGDAGLVEATLELIGVGWCEAIRHLLG